jgi:hypothetical protein
MICSSGEFVNNYLWKYVDMTITKAERVYLTKKQVHEPLWIDFLLKFKHVFKDESDIYNFSFVLSNIDEDIFKNFIVFYNTNVLRSSNTDIEFFKMTSIEDMISFIGENDENFKLLLISLYYYF